MTTYNDLTHNTRIQILKNILSDSKSLTEIANTLNISRPEVSRHLTQLRKISLVEKEDNLNSITPLGGLILEILSPLDFILDHYEFFMDHPFINFPSEFLYGINQLRNSQLLIGSGNIHQKFIEVAKKAHNKIYCVLNTPVPNYARVVWTEGFFIVPTTASSSALSHENLSKELVEYEFRKLSEINYELTILDEKYGFIYFPDKNGLPDNNKSFYVDSQEGITFLLGLWKYYWNKSKLFFKSNER